MMTATAGADPALGTCYRQALDELHAESGCRTVLASPSGVVLASCEAVAGAVRVLTPDGSRDAAGGLLLVPDHGIGRFGLAPARVAAPTGSAGPIDLATARQDGREWAQSYDAFGIGLLELHASALLACLDHTMSHLQARTSGGPSLLSRQQLQVQLADVAVDIAESRAAVSALVAAPLPHDPGMPAGTFDPRARWRVSQRLTEAGRRLLRMLGASGFLSDGPGGELYLAELVGLTYLHPRLDPQPEPTGA
jgi:hypothetical protein